MDLEWLQPYAGFPHTKAPRDEMLNLWNHDSVAINRIQYNDLYPASGSIDKHTHLAVLQTLMKDGFLLVENAPEAEDPDLLHNFVYRY